MTNSAESKPVCIYCKQTIEVINPLKMRDGFCHRACWIKSGMVRLPR